MRCPGSNGEDPGGHRDAHNWCPSVMVDGETTSGYDTIVGEGAHPPGAERDRRRWCRLGPNRTIPSDLYNIGDGPGLRVW